MGKKKQTLISLILLSFFWSLLSFGQSSPSCIEPKPIIVHVYASFLGREPSENDLQYYGMRLFMGNPHTITVKQFIQEITTSQEYKQSTLYPIVIKNTYRKILERDPSVVEYTNAINFLKTNSAFQFFQSIAKSEEHYDIFLRNRSEQDAVRKLQSHIVYALVPRQGGTSQNAEVMVSRELLTIYRRSYREAVDYLMNGATYFYGRDCVPEATGGDYRALIEKLSFNILDARSTRQDLKEILFTDGFNAVTTALLNSPQYMQNFGDSFAPGYASRLPVCTQSSPPTYKYWLDGDITWELAYDNDLKVMTNQYSSPTEKFSVAKLILNVRSNENGVVHATRAEIKFWPDGFQNIDVDIRDGIPKVNYRISQLPMIIDQVKKAKKIEFYLTGVNPTSAGTYIQYWTRILFYDSENGVPVKPD